jgi:hypothetical protein
VHFENMLGLKVPLIKLPLQLLNKLIWRLHFRQPLDNCCVIVASSASDEYHQSDRNC